jgi:hypothetical protein
MSSTLDSGYYSNQDSKKECLKSKDKKHKYEVTCGTPPSCEMTCKYCGHRFYTK